MCNPPTFFAAGAFFFTPIALPGFAVQTMRPIFLAVALGACGASVMMPTGGSAPPPPSSGICAGCPAKGFYCRLSTNRCEPGCGFDDDCDLGQICDQNHCIAGCRSHSGCEK